MQSAELITWCNPSIAEDARDPSPGAQVKALALERAVSELDH